MFFSLFIPIVRSQFSCLTDLDCQSTKISSIHSSFCVDNICQKVKPPGRHCNTAKECSSYYYYGSTACSTSCQANNECIVTGARELITQFCCKAVTLNRDCLKDRPNLLNGCDLKQICSLNSNNEYVCSTKRSTWVYGVFLSITGNLLINIGLNFQKLAFIKNEVVFLDTPISTFYLGILIYVFGKISGFSSYIFGNQSLLTSLGAVGLIANSIFAPMINNEIFTINDFLAIICVLLGSSVILMNSGKTHKVFSLCELMKMYKNKETIIWFIFVGFLISIIFLTIKFVEINSDWSYPDDFFSFLSYDIYFEETGILLRQFMVFLYVGMSGIIASMTTLFAKSFGEMIDISISGDNQFSYGVTYLFLILIIFCTFWQIYWLNRALRHYDALLCIPLFHVIWTCFSVTTAGIYFKDFSNYGYDQFKGFISGLIIIFIGSLFLATRVFNTGTIYAEESEVQRNTRVYD